jgi:acetolactate synthase I/II/III large subunit
MDPKQPLIPKPSSVIRPDGSMQSMPLEDMYPFLPREEFKKNMIVPPIDENP